MNFRSRARRQGKTLLLCAALAVTLAACSTPKSAPRAALVPVKYTTTTSPTETSATRTTTSTTLELPTSGSNAPCTFAALNAALQQGEPGATLYQFNCADGWASAEIDDPPPEPVGGVAVFIGKGSSWKVEGRTPYCADGGSILPPSLVQQTCDVN
jgi:hypothetical protein